MNILEIIVIITIAFCTIAGYYRGFLKTAYSIAAWFLVLVFVTAATPFFTGFLEKNTGLKDAIQEKCADYIEDLAEDQISMEAEGYGAGENSLIPNEIIEAITDSAASTVSGAFYHTGNRVFYCHGAHKHSNLYGVAHAQFCIQNTDYPRSGQGAGSHCGRAERPCICMAYILYHLHLRHK